MCIQHYLVLVLVLVLVVVVVVVVVAVVVVCWFLVEVPKTTSGCSPPRPSRGTVGSRAPPNG